MGQRVNRCQNEACHHRRSCQSVTNRVRIVQPEAIPYLRTQSGGAPLQSQGSRGRPPACSSEVVSQQFRPRPNSTLGMISSGMLQHLLEWQTQIHGRISVGGIVILFFYPFSLMDLNNAVTQTNKQKKDHISRKRDIFFFVMKYTFGTFYIWIQLNSQMCFSVNIIPLNFSMCIKKKRNPLNILCWRNLKRLPLFCKVVLAFSKSELIRKVFDGNSFAELTCN